jgi:poly(3-hydroxybutyrate) depolymerase
MTKGAIAAAAAVLATASPAQAQDLAVGSGRFERAETAGATAERQEIYYHRPAAWTPAGRVVVVMHGVNRDADRYRDEWRSLADQFAFLLIVPQFSATKFPGDIWYNFGGMVDAGGRPRPRESWSFGVLDRVFAEVRAATGAGRPTYSLYGHSAGAQFVHRYILFAPSPAVDMAVAANAGWYTMPVFGEAFPYGLKDSPATEADVRAFLARPLVLQLGEADTNPQHRSLRRTPEADRQGLHRFARGLNYLAVGKREAERRGVRLAWKLVTVPDVGHSNEKMAEHAARELFR